MKNLHEITPEKQQLDWEKLKFPDWTLSINSLNTAFTYAASGINNFTNALSGIYETTTEFTVPMTELGVEYVTREQYLSANYVPANWRIITDGF